MQGTVDQFMAHHRAPSVPSVPLPAVVAPPVPAATSLPSTTLAVAGVVQPNGMCSRVQGCRLALCSFRRFTRPLHAHAHSLSLCLPLYLRLSLLSLGLCLCLSVSISRHGTDREPSGGPGSSVLESEGSAIEHLSDFDSIAHNHHAPLAAHRSEYDEKQ